MMFFRPKWLQEYANFKWFMIIYGLLGTFQAMGYMYFIVTLTTIEKRFKIPSQTTGKYVYLYEIVRLVIKLLSSITNLYRDAFFAYQEGYFIFIYFICFELRSKLISSILSLSIAPGIILSGNEVSQIMLSMVLSYAGGQRNRPRWIAWGTIFCGISCFILATPHFIFGAGDDSLQLTKEYIGEANVSLSDGTFHIGLIRPDNFFSDSLPEYDKRYDRTSFE